MRRTRRMTSGERWELGLFLAMLIVGCLCLTAILNLRSVPRIFAWGTAAAQATQTEEDGAAGRGLMGGVSEASIQPLIFPIPESVPAVAGLMGRPSFLPEAFSIDDMPLPKVVKDPSPGAVVARAKEPVVKAIDYKTYKGQKYKYVKTLKLRVTAYAPDPRCTYPYPGTTTASGLSVNTNGGKLVAADTRLIAMHSLVEVPGYAGGVAVPVLDRGGAIKGARMDVLLPTFDKAKNWGSRMLEVKVYAPVGK